jgi:hypothetical protein
MQLAERKELTLSTLCQFHAYLLLAFLLECCCLHMVHTPAHNGPAAAAAAAAAAALAAAGCSGAL